MADGAGRAEQLDRREDVVHVVGRLAHAHEDDLLHHPAGPGERHLGDDLGAAELAQQAVAARHAEDAADRAADLGRHAQAIARQQHALHRLAVAQLDQQPRGAVLAAVFGAQTGERRQLGRERGQRLADAPRVELLGRRRAAIERQAPRPGTEQALLVAGLGAAVAQTLADVFDTHGRANVAPPGGEGQDQQPHVLPHGSRTIPI